MEAKPLALQSVSFPGLCQVKETQLDLRFLKLKETNPSPLSEQ